MNFLGWSLQEKMSLTKMTHQKGLISSKRLEPQSNWFQVCQQKLFQIWATDHQWTQLGFQFDAASTMLQTSHALSSDPKLKS